MEPIVLLLSLLPSLVMAQINKCVDANGRVEYRAEACDNGAAAKSLEQKQGSPTASTRVDAVQGKAPLTATPPQPQSALLKDISLFAMLVSAELTSMGYKADFSLASLKEIDRLFDDQVADGKRKPGTYFAENRGKKLFGVGSYVGEVIRRQTQSEWSVNEADPQAEINIALKFKNGLTIWPAQRALKRYRQERGEDIFPYGWAVVDKYSQPK